MMSQHLLLKDPGFTNQSEKRSSFLRSAKEKQDK